MSARYLLDSRFLSKVLSDSGVVSTGARIDLIDNGVQVN